jgi:hypothetical protein
MRSGETLMQVGWALAVIAGALICAPTAEAQALSFRDIPDKIEGSWAASAPACGSPSLVVSKERPYEFRFRFTAPIKSELVMQDRPPPPMVVGAPDPVMVTFTPAKAGTEPSSVNLDIDVEMPSLNVLTVKFRSDGKKGRWVRCAATGVG